MVNVSSVLLTGKYPDYILFKIAFHHAEAGKNIWFISPQPFDKVPSKITPPDREILQLITFLYVYTQDEMYLKDYKDLITHLNGIHLWQKTPCVIIVKAFEVYINLSSNNYSNLQAAFTTTTLLDSLATCSRKQDQSAFLIVSCDELSDSCIPRLKLLTNLYYLKHITISDDDTTFNEIINNLIE